MARSSELRSFDYVNHPYERVRDALQGDAVGVFRAATRAGADRARSLAVQLRVNLAGVEVGTEVDLEVDQVEETHARSGPSTRLLLRWQASERPHLFPLMRGELAVYPLTAGETQLDFSGEYQPPLGVLGAALDAVAGRRIAEASVHRFVSDVAAHLRERLSGG